MSNPYVISRRVGLVVCALAVVLAVGIIAYSRTTPADTPAVLPLSPSTALSPSLTWSESRITVNMSPGQSFSREVVFTSTKAFENVSFFVVPEIENFVAVVPGSFDSIVANQPHVVRLDFSSAQGTAVRSYQGTIHLRRNGSTIPQTLKITLNIGYQVFRSDGLGLRVAYPYTWETELDTYSLRVYDPDFPELPPAYEISVLSATPDPNLSRQDNLVAIAQARLGTNFLEVAQYTNNGVIVKADTITSLHFFTYSSSSNKAVEIRGSSPDFFSSNLFSAVSSSLTLY